MALNKQTMVRVFNYAGVRLPDPDPTMSLTEVRDFFANTGRPELTSAEVRGPEIMGTEQVFTLHRVTGTKGGAVKGKRPRHAPPTASRGMAAVLRRLATKADPGSLGETEAVVLAQLSANQGESPCYLLPQEVPWIA